MGFKVDFDALDTMYNTLCVKVGEWSEALNNVYTSVERLASSENMTGAGAENVKSYLSSVHSMILASLSEILSTQANNCLLYKRDYQDNIDTAVHAVIESDELFEIRKQLRFKKTNTWNVNSSIRNALTSVSDIFYTYFKSTDDMDYVYDKINSNLTTLESDISNLENRHLNADFARVEELISNLTAFINEKLSADKSYKTEFSEKRLANDKTFANLYVSFQALSDEQAAKADELELAYKNESARNEILQKEYEERQKTANWINWAVAGVCVIVSAAVIIGSGGMATPFVVAAVSGVSGLVMSGTQSITSQWVQTGDLSKTDWLKVGKDAAIGGITGFVTGYLGASIGGAITSKLTSMAGSALNSTSTVTRVATHAAIGSVSEIGSGTATRFAGNMITSGGNVQESLQTAFDPKSMLFDGVIGGVSGGVTGIKKPKILKTETYGNWNDMKSAHKGEITKFVSENKPKGSPVPKKWFEKGGTLAIETLDDDSQIWKYTSASGDTVSYVDGKIQFPEQYLHPNKKIRQFSIGEFSGDRNIDKQLAMNYLNKYGYDRIPNGYVLHHDIKNGTMQLVRADIHETFTHYGGYYYNNIVR